MNVSLFGLLVSLSACSEVAPDGAGPKDSGELVVDADGDGAAANADCDDGDAGVYPGAVERCNGIDDDCDGNVDPDESEGAPTWYADADGDGFGDVAWPVVACEAPGGSVEADTDCDDADADVHPGAAETCNDVDDDCDGVIDPDDSLGVTAWHADADADGFGNAADVVYACDAPTERVSDASDCDDTNPAVNRGATELCNGVDDNCDGDIDPSASADALEWYSDADGDGFGDPSSGAPSCTQLTGTVSDASDCDDTNLAVHPGAGERCNGVDDDCDGTTDPAESEDASSWYADADGDSFGDGVLATTACTAAAGWVADDTDCDDADGSVFPGAIEVCNGLDDDCDTVVDPDSSADASTWYVDDDGDGYGDASRSSISCSAPADSVGDASDCDDAAAGAYPGAAETCEGTDEDCNGAIDDNATDGIDVSTDGDGDGFGDPATTTRLCSKSAGQVEDDTDCDDTDSTVHPDADELCWNGADDDCDSFDSTDPDCAPLGSGSASVVVAEGGLGATLNGAVAFVETSGGGGRDAIAFGVSSTAGSVWVFQTIVADAPIAVESYADINIDGVSASDAFGASLAAVGDMDGDGTEELAVGASGVDTTGAGAGAVYVFDMTAAATAVTSAASADVILGGRAAGDGAGASVASAGDLDGDGLDDLILGAPGDDLGGAAAGAVWVAFGGEGSHTLALGTDAVFVGEMPSDGLGLGAGVGDMDGDGHPDLAISATANDAGGTSAGRVYLFRGPFHARRYEAGAASLKITGAAAGDMFGTALAAGDIDADGNRDLLSSAPGHDEGTSASAGAVTLFQGPLPAGYMESDAADLLIVGDAASDSVSAVASGADLDQDGWDDVLVGAVGEDLLGAGVGGAFLFYGPLASGTLRPSDADAALAEAGSAGAGSRLAMGGDIDGDGYPDLAYMAASATYGAVAVHTGGSREAAVATAPDLTTDDDADGYSEADGDCDDGRSGRSPGVVEACGVAGDENCNDWADRCGPAAALDPATLTTVIDGSGGASGNFGSAVALVGDLNGDGAEDLAVGDSSYDSGAGRIYIWFGPVPEVALTESSADAIIEGGGSSLASAGDLDGDGCDELAASWYVYRGGPELQGTIAAADYAWAFEGVVETVGDVNADGYDDILVETRSGPSGVRSATAGAFSLVLGPVAEGSYTGYSHAAGTWIGDGEPEDLGETLQIAGDVNGDGADDLLVGAAGSKAFEVSGRNTHRGGLGLWYGLPVLGTELESASSDAWILSGEDGPLGWASGDLDGDGLADVVFGGDDDFEVMSLAGLARDPVLGDEAFATVEVGTGWVTTSLDVRDLDRDGYGDLFFAGYESTAAPRGALWIFRGPLSGSYALADADYILTGSATWWLYGEIDAGDLDGDGFADVTMGAPSYGSASASGAVLVVYGGWTSTTDGHTPTWTDPAVDGDGDGYSADAGDCHDGRADVFPGGTEVCGDAVDDDCDGSAPACAPVGSVTVSPPYPRIYGGRISVVGDVNGDALPDVFGVDTNYDFTYLVFAPFKAGTITDTAAEDVYWTSPAGYGDPTGERTGLDDWDGDLTPELAVAAADDGEVYVLASGGGYTSGTYADAPWEFDASRNDDFGAALVNAGDPDGDGVSALGVGAPDTSSEIGAVYLFGADLAPGAWTTAAAESVFTGASGSERLGDQIVPLGDHDGDGFDDLAIGDDNLGSTVLDRSWIWFGDGTTGTFAAEDAPIIVSRATTGGSHSGIPVAVGDLDGDGKRDFALAQADLSTTVSDGGSVFVWSELPPLGASSATSADLVISGSTYRAAFGTSVAPEYDLDGDGYADLVANEPDEYGAELGALYVWYGPITLSGSLLANSADGIVTGDSDNKLRGELQPAGDLDSDGFDDLWVNNTLWPGGAR